MARYLVEHYLPASGATALLDDAARLRSGDGASARLLMSFYAAEDEICFHLFDAQSASDVRRVSTAAGIEVDRIVGVVTVGADPADGD